jgi:cell division septum initiation protein DivIVA
MSAPTDPAAPAQRAPRFVTVMRGYDRVEVDEHLRSTERVVAKLRAELAASEARRRRAEERADSLENEIRDARTRLDSTSVPPEGGFGVRAEKLLRLAEQEASELRAAAGREAAAVRQEVRAEAEEHRHEVEQSLITRSAQFDERASQRTAELQQREQQIADQLEAARSETEALQAAARRAADQYRQRVEADAEEIKTRAAGEAAKIREQAGEEFTRLSALEDGVRADLGRLAAVLSQELSGRAVDVQAVPGGADGGPAAADQRRGDHGPATEGPS